MKRYVMEFVGTFFLTIAVVWMGGNGLAVGAMLLALAYIGAHISGAHYNPSFTLASFLNGALVLNTALGYMVAQLAGALLALLAIYLLVGVAYIHPIVPEISVWVLFSIEVGLTFVFTMVFLALNHTSHLRNNQIYGLAIGFTLAAIVFFGGLYNSAIGLASLLLDTAVKRQVTSNVLWYVIIYIGAALVAAVFAAYLHRYLNADCLRACSTSIPCDNHEVCKNSSCSHENCMHTRCISR